VLCLAHEVSANLDRPPGLDLVPEPGVMNQDEEHTLDIESDGARCVQPLFSPPLRSTFDLALSASLDHVPQSHG
jgi:hypothetical protein